MNKNKAVPDTSTLAGRLTVCAQKAGGKRNLAGAAIISEAQLFRYLNGLSDIPLEKVISIARAAQVDPAWLATGHTTAAGGPRPPFRPALMQFTARMLDELLLEYQHPVTPHVKSNLLTLIYEALRHEEALSGTESFPGKFRMLEILTFFEACKTEELLATYHRVMSELEYGTLDPHQHQLLSVFCNLVTKGWENYYNNYVGQMYFERMGYELAEEARQELHGWVGMALEKLGRSDLAWLDLGCGNGRHLAFLHKHYPKLALKGLELSEQGTNLCHKLEQQGKLTAGTVTQGEADDLPFADNSMDVVFTRQTLQFLPYLPGSGLGVEKAFEELHRILKVRGLLIIKSLPGTHRCYTTFFQHFSEEDVRHLADNHGFEVLSFVPSTRVSDNEGGKNATFTSTFEDVFTLVLRKK